MCGCESSLPVSCTAWFTVEVILRFVACPSKLGFWRDFKNIVDVVAIVPYYVTLFNVLSTMSCTGAKSSASLAFLRVIRLVRIFKLTKHSVGLQVLLLTFRASLEGLGMFLVALFVCLFKMAVVRRLGFFKVRILTAAGPQLQFCVTVQSAKFRGDRSNHY